MQCHQLIMEQKEKYTGGQNRGRSPLHTMNDGEGLYTSWNYKWAYGSTNKNIFKGQEIVNVQIREGITSKCDYIRKGINWM